MAKAFPLLTISPTGVMGDNIGLILHIRLGEMLSFARFIDDPARIEELHAMRIATKRLRYTMELFSPYLDGALGEWLSALLAETKKIQELIGEIHDRDVRVPLIVEFMEQHERSRPEIHVGLLALAEQEAADRIRLYDELIAMWHTRHKKYISRMARLIGALARETSRFPENLSAKTL